jgi:hypothetical protein
LRTWDPSLGTTCMRFWNKEGAFPSASNLETIGVKPVRLCFCCGLLLLLTGCSEQEAPREYFKTTGAEICQFLDYGFVQALDGKVDTKALPYSLSEFESQFGVSKERTGRLFQQGVGLGREYINRSDDEIDAVREAYQDACIQQVSDPRDRIVVKLDWVAIIGEENDYRDGSQRFDVTMWEVKDETRERCERFLESVRGDAAHGICITREQADRGVYPWWTTLGELY